MGSLGKALNPLNHLKATKKIIQKTDPVMGKLMGGGGSKNSAKAQALQASGAEPNITGSGSMMGPGPTMQKQPGGWRGALQTAENYMQGGPSEITQQPNPGGWKGALQTAENYMQGGGADTMQRGNITGTGLGGGFGGVPGVGSGVQMMGMGGGDGNMGNPVNGDLQDRGTSVIGGDMSGKGEAFDNLAKAKQAGADLRNGIGGMMPGSTLSQPGMQGDGMGGTGGMAPPQMPQMPQPPAPVTTPTMKINALRGGRRMRGM